MKVILHDFKDDISNGLVDKADKVIFADGKYAPCQGCFKCWTKHPATCAMTDSLHEICRVLGQADELTIITENCYGGYSSDVKCVLDRGIGLSTPMSTYRGKMMHHTLRYGKHNSLRVFVYGDITEKEKETWNLLVKANSLNYGYSTYTVSFVSESELKEGTVL